MWHRDSWIITAISLCLFVAAAVVQATPLEGRPPPPEAQLEIFRWPPPLGNKAMNKTAEDEDILWTITAYCPCPKCCGRWAYYRGGGWTASGTRATPGRTCAVDPRVIPLGKRIYIKGIGVLVAEDTGSAVKGRHIDVFCAMHEEALKFGRQKRRVVILDDNTKHVYLNGGS